jgi:ATP-binding cassette subfamily C protein
MERSGAPLSGGQKQRIALARAFFGEPSLVVLDEPNSNLDAAGEQALTNTLQRAKEKRITVVVITQRPAVLNSMDKVLVLRAGRVEAFGPPRDVLSARGNGHARKSNGNTPPALTDSEGEHSDDDARPQGDQAVLSKRAEARREAKSLRNGRNG